MTNTEFPLPNRWSTHPQWPRRLEALILVAVIIWLAVLAGNSSLNHDWQAAAFYLTTAVACIAAMALLVQPVQMYRRRRLDHPDVASRHGRLWIEQRGRDLVVQIVLLIASAAACVMFSLGLWTDTLNVSVSPGFAFAAPGLAVLVAVYAVIQFGLLLGREFSMSTLVMSPDGVRVVYGISDRSLGWDSIGHLSINTPAVGRRRSIDCVIYLQSPDKVRRLDVNTSWLSTGCAPTYWFVKYYVEHPEDRDELGDQRAIDRLMSGRVVTDRKNYL